MMFSSRRNNQILDRFLDLVLFANVGFRLLNLTQSLRARRRLGARLLPAQMVQCLMLAGVVVGTRANS